MLVIGAMVLLAGLLVPVAAHVAEARRAAVAA